MTKTEEVLQDLRLQLVTLETSFNAFEKSIEKLELIQLRKRIPSLETELKNTDARLKTLEESHKTYSNRLWQAGFVVLSVSLGAVGSLAVNFLMNYLKRA